MIPQGSAARRDGTRLIDLYRDAGLNLNLAENAVEAGIYACEQLMYSGRLKVFSSLSNWYSEFRLYRRDQDGHIVKEHDHLMDAMRYLTMSGRDRMRTKPKPQVRRQVNFYPDQNQTSWMM